MIYEIVKPSTVLSVSGIVMFLLTGCASTQHSSPPAQFTKPCPPAASRVNDMQRVSEILGSGARAGGAKLTGFAKSSASTIVSAVHIPDFNGKESYPCPVSASRGQSSSCGYCWPCYGTISRGFKRGHKGLDILADTGSPVFAANSGNVIYSGRGLSGYGNVVIIDHGNDMATLYAHNSKNLVSPGDSVRQGQQIAQVGQTGRATAPHCHFEVRQGGSAVNPRHMLP